MAPVGRATAAAAGLVSWAHDDLELAYREIGLAVKADERTVRRWERREAVPRARHMAKLEELRELRHLLEAVFAFRAGPRLAPLLCSSLPWADADLLDPAGQDQAGRRGPRNG